MKKLCLLVILVVCFMMSACDDKSETHVDFDVLELVKYNVTLNIECVENIFFSRYDVNVLIDGEELSTIDHGGQDTYSLELTKGEHTLSFEKEDDGTVDGNIKFNISSDTTLEYKVSCTNDQIEVEEIEFNEEFTDNKIEAEENEINKSDGDKAEKAIDTETKKAKPILDETHAKVPQNSRKYSSKNYKDVMEELQQAGFTNIKTEVIYDVDIGWLSSLSRGEVKSISINGLTEFEKEEIFEKNCEIIITYRDFEINDPNVQYNSYTVAKLIQDLDSNAMNAKDTHTGEYVEITGRIETIDASGKYFSLYPTNNEWAIQGVLCDVQTDEQKEKIKDFVSGNVVTVKGKITSVGEVLGYSMDIYSIP